MNMRAPASDLPILFDGVSLFVRDLVILDRVNLMLTAGAPTVLIGPNGSGKTTLLRLAMGLIAPTSGRVTWAGRDDLPPERRAALELAAEAVRSAGATTARQPAGTVSSSTDDWDARADRLLAERAAAAQRPGPVEMPAALSASAVVRLDRDPEAFAAALRRPVPQPPSPQARLGTRFHAWVEGYFGAATLVDVDALPGADDDSLPAAADLERLREAFRATPWADRRPMAVEQEVHTSVDGYVVNSRIDAVFGDVDRTDVPDGVVVVDWKTGRPPEDPAERAARELQLAVYRLAWSRWKGLPLEKVRAAFCYVATGTTVYPEHLLDEEGITALLRGVTE